MKKALRCLVPLAAGAALVAVTGCSSMPVQTRQNVGVPTYPPTNPATVQILREAPAREAGTTARSLPISARSSLGCRSATPSRGRRGEPKRLREHEYRRGNRWGEQVGKPLGMP
jgi:hypothetical protein